MNYLNTSFNQVRMSDSLNKYTTYPNGLVVFERGSGEMRILSTEEEYDNSFMCYSIEAKNFREFNKDCESFSKNADQVGGKLYVIDLWKVESVDDVKFNEDLIMYFSKQPQLMFD